MLADDLLSNYSLGILKLVVIPFYRILFDALQVLNLDDPVEYLNIVQRVEYDILFLQRIWIHLLEQNDISAADVRLHAVGDNCSRKYRENAERKPHCQNGNNSSCDPGVRACLFHLLPLAARRLSFADTTENNREHQRQERTDQQQRDPAKVWQNSNDPDGKFCEGFEELQKHDRIYNNDPV